MCVDVLLYASARDSVHVCATLLLSETVVVLPVLTHISHTFVFGLFVCYVSFLSVFPLCLCHTVSLAPSSLTDIPALSRGLKLLAQADANVESRVADSGELTVTAIGELHLEKCLKDLRERFAQGVKFSVSEPIVAYRETLAQKNELSYSAQQSSSAASASIPAASTSVKPSVAVEAFTPDKRCALKIRAVPLPEPVTKYLEKSAERIKYLVENGDSETDESKQWAPFVKELEQKLKESGRSRSVCVYVYVSVCVCAFHVGHLVGLPWCGSKCAFCVMMVQ